MPDPRSLRFKNELMTDFSMPASRQAMEEALRHVRSQLGGTYSLVIDGKRLKSRSTIKSLNPSHPEQVVGIVQNADPRLADRALETAERTFESWSQTPAWKRTEILRQMARLLRNRKF